MDEIGHDEFLRLQGQVYELATLVKEINGTVLHSRKRIEELEEKIAEQWLKEKG